MAFIHLALGAAALAVLLAAALQDLRERLIANRFSLALLVLGSAQHVLLADGWRHALTLAGGALALAAIVFVVGFVLWRFGGLGGGDVKLLTAAAFLVGADGIGGLLLITALAGGVLALLCVVVPRIHWASMLCWRLAAGGAGAGTTRTAVPYGVAIAIGAAWVIVPSLPHLLG